MPATPDASAEARDLLHLSAIQAWQAIASGQAAPYLDPAALQQAIYEAFTTSDGISHVDRLCDDWLEQAPQARHPRRRRARQPPARRGRCHHAHRHRAIWLGLTTGYLALTGSYHIPRKFLYGHPD
jgi:hypothetical protein